MNVLNRLVRFAEKAYRDTFLETATRGSIAFQIQALRRKFGLSQSQFAERVGKRQSAISRLESADYGKVTVQTLLEIATALNVALLVRFVSYPEFLERNSDMSDRALQPDTIFESLQANATVPSQPDRMYRRVYQASRYPLSDQRPPDLARRIAPEMTFANRGLQSLMGVGAQQAQRQPHTPLLQRQN